MARKSTVIKSSNGSNIILKPNTLHPQALKISKIIKSNQHQHSSSYHSFINSPYYPISTNSSSDKKCKRAASSTASDFPSLVNNPIEVKVLNEKVLNWFDSVKESRGMPWRKEVIVGEGTREERSQRGYEVWVSEIMLQQTQVSTVIAYWNKWMITFPTVADLAKADIEEVNKVWAGLGYYSRASRLLAGAKTVMNSFDGYVPETVAELERIDGIGPYSAGAISSIAYCARSPVVDGNVTRVLSRLTALHALSTAKSTTNFIWALSDLLVPLSTPASSSTSSTGLNKSGAWNQALMELGATICMPKNPTCLICPLSEECLAYAEIRTGKIDRLPPPKKNFFDLSKPKVVEKKEENEEEVVGDLEDLCSLCTSYDSSEKGGEDLLVTRYPMAKLAKKSREEETAVCLLEWESSEESSSKGDRKILLFKRPEKGLLAGLFDFPSLDLAPEEESTPQIRAKQITNLLSRLLVNKLPSPSTSSSKSKIETPLNVAMRKELASITQVYSHQKRQYHIQRIVLSSPSLPELKPSSSTPTSSTNDRSKSKAKSQPTKGEEESIHSIPGRGKWVDEADVLESNIGGAMIKVWEVRQGGKGDSGSTVKKVKVNGKSDTSTAKVVKNGSGGGKGKRLDRYETSEEEEEAVESSEEAESSEVEVVEQVKDEVEKVPYKKRRIVISDNEDEED